MAREKSKVKNEIQDGIEEFNKNRVVRKSGITKQEWEHIKTTITLTAKQEDLYRGIRNNTLTIVQGPAGTAKTYISCYSALGLLADKEIERIILTKPIQESGEFLGALPGDIAEKTSPFIQSYFSTFQKIVGKQSLEFMKSMGEVVVEPLAYMRGTTYDDCIMLLDEAQNCTMSQLMLWATRLGRNSKAVMMGDISQYDIKKRDSKFIDFISMITGEYKFREDDLDSKQDFKKPLDQVYSHKFGVEDIVRNKFLIDLVDRYEKYKFQNNL